MNTRGLRSQIQTTSALSFGATSIARGITFGRALWQPDSDQGGTYVCGSLDDGKRRERCIGAGAHTHYWDETAPEIAEELDRLIEAT